MNDNKKGGIQVTVSGNQINRVNVEFGVEVPPIRRGSAAGFRNPLYKEIAAKLTETPGEMARIGVFDKKRMVALRVAFRDRDRHGIVLSQRRLPDGNYEVFGAYEPWEA